MNINRLMKVARTVAHELNVDPIKTEAALAAALMEIYAKDARDEAAFRRVHVTPYRDEEEFEQPRRPGYIRIPYLSKSEHAAPLKRIIAQTADRSHEGDFTVGMVMSYLLEGIALEVGSGNVVRIPGFGIFGPWCWSPKDGGDQVVCPRFVAVRPLRNEVRERCLPREAQNDVLRNFQRSHHPSSQPSKHSLTITAMEAFRAHIRRQMGRDE